MDITPCRKSHIGSLWKHRDNIVLDGNTEVIFEGKKYQSGPGKEVRRWRMTKKGAKRGLIVSSAALSTAQTATSSPTLVTLALTGAAAGASATGIGLLVTGSVLMLASNALSWHSFLRTCEHLGGLRQIDAKKHSYECSHLAGRERNNEEHTIIKEQVLPYIILKKDAKTSHKFVGAIPVANVLESGRAVLKKGIKFLAGSLGKHRRDAASWLAVHLITHNCALAQAIVANLYSFEEMLWLQRLDSEELIPLLEEKMKST